VLVLYLQNYGLKPKAVCLLLFGIKFIEGLQRAFITYRYGENNQLICDLKLANGGEKVNIA
jgi:hypothetical protein